MEVKGFKAFNKDLTNRYGQQFRIGNIYDEKFLFENRYKNDINIINYIRYYQDGIKDIYERQYVKRK